MKKQQAIDSISGLYPADSEYPESREIGKQFMQEAMEEAGFNWRDLPENVLSIYAEKCERKEFADQRKFEKKYNG